MGNKNKLLNQLLIKGHLKMNSDDPLILRNNYFLNFSLVNSTGISLSVYVKVVGAA